MDQKPEGREKMMPVKNLFRHYSKQALLVIAGLGGAQAMLPTLKEFLPPWVSGVVAAAGLIGALIPQDKKETK
jgi:Na+/proline symporter